MKKLLFAVFIVGLLTVFYGVDNTFADCPDYKLTCQDGTTFGPWGTCWSWHDFMCLPCTDHGDVCSGHGGPKCLWFSSWIEELVLAAICAKAQIPKDKCIVCE